VRWHYLLLAGGKQPSRDAIRTADGRPDAAV